MGCSASAAYCVDEVHVLAGKGNPDAALKPCSEVIVLEQQPPAASKPSQENVFSAKLQIETAKATKEDKAAKEDGRSSGFHGNVQLMGHLGRGSFAQVYAAQAGNRRMAVKVSEIRTQQGKNFSPSGNQLVSGHVVQREIDILKRVSGRTNCLSFYGSYIEKDVAYMVMEFCDTSALAYFEQQDKMTGEVFRSFMRQAITALDSIHEVGVVHRDVKPDNFLVCLPKGRSKCSKSDYVLKLCDFGLSAMIGKHSLSGCFGTAPFMSPEMVSGQTHDRSTDIWSAGAMLYTMMYGRFPYRPAQPSSTAMKEAIKTGERPIRFEMSDMPPAMKTAVPLLKQMLCRVPSLRPTAKEALKHNWFTTSAVSEDTHDYGVAFSAAKRVGLFDVRNTSKKEDQELTPLEVSFVKLQSDFFPQTSKHCVEPFLAVLARCKYEDNIETAYCSSSGSTCSGSTSQLPMSTLCSTVADATPSRDLMPTPRNSRLLATPRQVRA